jgi:hypothetical protein
LGVSFLSEEWQVIIPTGQKYWEVWLLLLIRNLDEARMMSLPMKLYMGKFLITLCVARRKRHVGAGLSRIAWV